MSLVANSYKKLPSGVKTTLARMKVFKLYTWYLKRSGTRFVTKTIDGIVYNLDLYTYVGSSLYNFGVYEKSTTEIINNFVKPGMTVIDVGASIGAHTLRLAKLVGPAGKVYAFEPSENLLPLLKSGIAQNKFLNVFPEELALSSKDGTEEVDMTLLGNLDRSTPKEEKKRVPSITLDSYVKKRGLERLDFIKIDTDGFEVEILKGAYKTLKQFRPRMVIEFRQSTAKPIVEILRHLGYSFNHEEPPYESYDMERLENLKKNVINVFCVYEQG